MAFSSGGSVKVLPLEWSNKVCSYLDGEDLLNLSACNTYWRNAVNHDSIWKPLCVKQFDVNPSEAPIIRRKCRVQPAFKIMRNRSHNLTDLCPWRIRYAQEIRVVNNWKLKKYHSQIMPKKMEDLVSTIGLTYLVYGNFVVIIYPWKTKISIWKITDHRCIEMEPIKIDSSQSRHFHPLRNGFIVTTGLFIHLYLANEKGFELKIRTYIEKALHPDIPLLGELSQLERFNENRFNFKELVDERVSPKSLHPDMLFFLQSPSASTHFQYRATVNERYIVFYQSNDDSVSFIVWDLKDLKTFFYELSESVGKQLKIYLAARYSPIMYMVNDKSVHFEISVLNIESSSIALLRKSTLKGNSFRSKQIFCDTLVLIRKEELVLVNKDGEIGHINFSHVKSVLNCTSFYCETDDDKMILIDEKRFSVAKVLDIERNREREVIIYMHATKINFVFLVSISSDVELYDLKNFRRIEYDNDVALSMSNCSKIVLSSAALTEGRRYIYHFW